MLKPNATDINTAKASSAILKGKTHLKPAPRKARSPSTHIQRRNSGIDVETSGSIANAVPQSLDACTGLRYGKARDIAGTILGLLVILT